MAWTPRPATAPSGFTLRVLGALVMALLFYLAVKDTWVRHFLAKAGKTQAISTCISQGETAEACQGLVSSRHDVCWELAYRAPISSKYNRGTAARLDQSEYGDCIVHGPNAVKEAAARAREQSRSAIKERDAILH